MKTINRLASFVKADHRYVYLGTSVIAALGLAFSQRNPTPLSFLAPTGIFQDCLWAILWAWLVVSAAALVTKLMHWNDYREKSPFASERFRRGARLGSYVVVAIAAIFFIDRCVMSFIDLVQVSIVSDSNPSDILPSLVYMTYKSGDFFIRGIEITIALATFGTVIAFFLALLFVFLRIQTFDRVDNDLTRFFKSIGRGFATVYSTIVRGTPMMVQGLLIYYAGFTVLRGMGFETAQANQIWSTFTAGLVTISLNSTAYMMEVLRGGIESIDPGQAEAARSLGLSQWQAMRKVVFPQGIKNAIPALTNELIINIKDSSVLSVIGVFDLMYATTTVAGVYYRQMEVYCVALVVYLILTLVASRLLEAFGKKLGAEAPATLPSSNYAQDEENHHGRYRHYRRRGRRTKPRAAHPRRGPAQELRLARGAQGHRPCRQSRRGRHHHRRLGLGQVDLPALPQPARDPGRGPHLVPRPGPYGRALQHQ